MRRLLLVGIAVFCLCATCHAQIVQPRGVLSGLGYKNYLFTGTMEDFYRGYFDSTLKFAVDKNGNIVTVGTVDGVDVSAHAADVTSHANWPAGLTLAELGWLDGVTSSIQSQLDAKLPTATYTSHAADASAHHAPVTAGTGISVTGQQVTNTDTGSATRTAHELAYDHTLLHREPWCLSYCSDPTGQLTINGEGFTVFATGGAGQVKGYTFGRAATARRFRAWTRQYGTGTGKVFIAQVMKSSTGGTALEITLTPGGIGNIAGGEDTDTVSFAADDIVWIQLATTTSMTNWGFVLEGTYD